MHHTSTVAPSSRTVTAQGLPLSSSRLRFRGDIQGLRAVAVLSVLGFHAGVPFLAGGYVGVDVFFVISGFLITGLIHREIEQTGRLGLGRFWARRARRLLPATAVVLGAVAAMTIAVLPVTRWASTAWDIGASALYVVNWRLAGQSVDYLANDAPSPVQHFWSLAVEEQFYLVWPVLLVLLAWVRRRRGWRLDAVMLAGIAAIGLPSLAWSLWFTEANPGQAYFVSTTRLWELAAGAALAVVAHRLDRLPGWAAHVLGLAGLVAIGYAAVRFDAATPFPGSAALVPVLGAAAVIVAGGAGRRSASARLLGVAPMRGVGTLSYSLYLWHWPLLVGAAVLWGGDDGTLTTAAGLAVVVFSLVPAWLTYRLVEAPVHHAGVFARRPSWAGVLGVACTAAGVAAALVVALAIPRPVYTGNTDAPGAAALSDDPGSDPDGRPADAVDSMVPDVLAAPDDMAMLDGELCISDIDGTELESCTFGPPDAAVTIAVVGDSKMHQWLPALERVAAERGWRLVTYLKSTCPLTTVDVAYDGEPNEWCAEYNDARLDRLRTDDSIDYVLTSQVAGYAAGDEPEVVRAERMATDLSGVWSGLEAAGRDVVVMLDNPNPQGDVMECVATHPEDLRECAFPRADGVRASGAPPQQEALDGLDGVGAVDLRDFICPGDQCPAVIGETLVYRRGSHLTATYVESLTPRLDEALLAAM
ncbi:Peptidoglycan/LPS O-acetylase OafA/YrhL, contains acyltransferase and SGNH-hydrolase domains [Jiangella alkaliphila]|uniref:Peptidoglycan/LPS O-acetylase OafA/YrhL, contains acyltransferase and SGNH-hydrolase domains n=1 Tax=Jiangella alkaliphila TaxID=419479 RepID=A0A1H2LYT4_9ACTN|nr:Peptidoglycan/LPS O-acetylase OafA/YrhL, contains acyltransferase and SGNH-hydrolase domains [Jiangella alkaliphila]